MATLFLGYYPDWTESLAPERIDFSLFTHIAHAFAQLTPDGNVKPLSRARPLCRAANEKKVAVLLSVGGADSRNTLRAVTADDGILKRCVDGLQKQVEEAGYAGVDVDFEGMTSAEDRDRLNRFVVALRQRLGKDPLLTMAVSAGAYFGQWYDEKTLLTQLNYLNVMTYDFHGPWSERAGHNANLLPYPGDEGLSFVSALDYWAKTKNWPRERLLFGVPCYGRGFAARQWGNTVDKTRKIRQEYAGWHEIEALRKLGWKRQQDEIARVPYLVSPRGDELISYEDFDSAKEKGAWCRKERLAGLFFWEVSQDFADGSHTVVRGARRGFLNR